MAETSEIIEIDITKLQPGDHIFTYLLEGVFTHHGIYVGNEMVIHFIPGPTIGNEEFPKSGPCERCQGYNGGSGAGVIMTGKVVKSCLHCFGDKTFLYKYGVSWIEALTSTCCPYQSKSLQEGRAKDIVCSL
ncbi:LRAT domain-containing protein [Cephalotus follicularis]|uniref:LRAT domain-containing protein n=1 Tax=Cephalotus follicularis TaxID=3775 RepID=A0A1Q3C1V8_CEPFO|nr:LRAT domain-containing protein [Cephalotus follicularis]